ncbi:MAG: ceramidase domain-containing protein [Rickettsiales bacterium]|nr:ceramidase domain-containing protein [Rickettsiales bacterium]
MKKTTDTKTKYKIATIVVFLVTLIMFCFDPIAQPQLYHKFADSRILLELENFFDVISNIPFIILSLMGLYYIYKTNPKRSLFSMKGEKLLWQIFFLGVFLVGFGSGYYHLSPKDPAIIWDRIPITIAFMALFSLMIMEYIDAKLGVTLSPILLIAGIGTVYYWYYTEVSGQGDLRPYVLVQLIPLILIPLMLILFSPHYTQSKYIFFSIGWYAVAKLLEISDKIIFKISNNMISGHTLKHLAVAAGVYMMLRYLKTRNRV